MTRSDGASDRSYLLLSSDPVQPSPRRVKSARPKWTPLLGVTALADLVYSTVMTIRLHNVRELRFMLALGFVRPCAILLQSASTTWLYRRWIIWAQLAATFMGSLYLLNELVQTRHSSKHTSHKHLFDPSGPRRDALIYSFVELALAVTHWLLYAVVIGITRRAHIATDGRPRSSSRYEHLWAGEQVSVSPGRSGSETRSTDLHIESDNDRSFSEDDHDDGDSSSSSDDQDEIVDMPRPSEIRRRVSRASIGRHDQDRLRTSPTKSYRSSAGARLEATHQEQLHRIVPSYGSNLGGV